MNNKLILGTVQFGLDYGINNSNGKMSEIDVFRILDFAHDNGIVYLDTAAAYGNAEDRIGRYLASKENRSFKIITKFDLKQNPTPIESLESSLYRLNCDKVNTVMFHSFEDFNKSKPNDIKALLKLKGKKFDRLGISVYTNAEIKKICDSNFFDVVQLPYNLLDNNNLRGEHLALLQEKNIEVHTRSVFLQGLFFMNPSEIKGKLSPLSKYIEQINQIASKNSLDLAALALGYSLSNNKIDGVLIGVDSLIQFEHNINLLSEKIKDNVFNEIDVIQVNELELLNPATWKV
jgi:aryl-alcohol dehydrogenase-like predicted oxidoreductase